MEIATLVFFVLGLALLIFGAEILVRGAVRLATLVGISPLVIGLTVVAFGTSSPELAVSIQGALTGQADLALGNVVGSNIFNVLLILGLSATLVPMLVSQQLVRLDVPIMIGASVLMLVLGVNGQVSRTDGLILFLGIIGYTAFLIIQGRKENPKVGHETKSKQGGKGGALLWLLNFVLIILGLLLLVVGSRWLINGAMAIARALEVSELIIGLTIVAAGTSLPEVATSVVAAFRGQRDIAVGNIVGSNIFNILAVLGLASIVAPNGVTVSSAALSFDIPVMLAVAVACLPIFFTGHVIARWEGVLFLGYYIAYTAYLALDSTGHELLPLFNTIMIAFVVPITFLTLLTVVIRQLRRQP